MTKLDHAFAEIASADVDPDADFSLPGWIYHDREFFDLEMERVIRPSWQIVCHVSEVAEPGDYRTIDYLGESVIVIRGDDGELRAFVNVCRHRAMRLVEGPSGCTSCASRSSACTTWCAYCRACSSGFGTVLGPVSP